MNEEKLLSVEEMTFPIEIQTQLPKAALFRYESIPLSISLQNKTDNTLKIFDLRPEYRQLKFDLTDSAGNVWKADQMTPVERDGQRVPDAEQMKQIELMVGEKRFIEVDLLALFGALKPSEYQITVRYYHRGLDISSKPLPFAIKPVRPVAINEVWDYDRVADSPLRSAWLAREDKGLGMFYSARSPYDPNNFQHSGRVLSVDNVKSVIPAMGNSYRQGTTGLFWLEGSNFLNWIIISNGKSQDKIRKQKLTFDEVSLPVSPFVDSAGNATVALLVKKGAGWGLEILSIVQEQPPRFTALTTLKEKPKAVAFLVDIDGVVHLAWDAEGKAIYYSSGSGLAKTPVFSVPRVVAGGLRGLCTIDLFTEFDDATEKLLVYANVLTQPDFRVQKYHGYIFAVADGKKTGDTEWEYIAQEGLVLHQALADPERRWHLLLGDESGRLFYGSSLANELKQLVPEEAIDPKDAVSPALIISTKWSSRYGVWWRYIARNELIEYQLVEHFKP